MNSKLRETGTADTFALRAKAAQSARVSFFSRVNLRYVILIGGLLAVFACLIARLCELQIIKQAFLQHQGDARTIRLVKIPATRGVITDRNGEPLAVSTLVKSVWVNPQKFQPSAEQWRELIKTLHLNPNELTDKLNKYQDKEFLYLRRHVVPAISQKIVDMNITGVHLQEEFKRYYPAGEVMAQVIGFTDIDDNGQEGLELKYNAWLTGQAGVKRIVRDRFGREVELLAGLVEQRPGNQLVLSLDQRLQYLVFRELKVAMERHKASTASAVVLDVTTGEVLAMVNLPSFNPNARSKDAWQDHYRNRAVTDYFEPGSALKAFSMLSVLEHNKQVNRTTLVDTAPGYLKLPGGVVRDIRNNGLLDVTAILQHSSNVGVTKLVLNLPENALWDTYSRLGFGESTNSGFPGESGGILEQQRFRNQFELATLAFGYGIGVTPLQLARAYAILGAGGVKLPVSFLKSEQPGVGYQVISAEISRNIIDMLAEVIENGRSNAKVMGYRIAGKTGTTRKVGKFGYEEGRHRAVFAGLAPAVNPKFAIAIMVNEPNAGMYYSNQVAAPVFSKIAAGALRLFNVAPDLLETQGVYIVQSGNNHS